MRTVVTLSIIPIFNLANSAARETENSGDSCLNEARTVHRGAGSALVPSLRDQQLHQGSLESTGRRGMPLHQLPIGAEFTYAH